MDSNWAAEHLQTIRTLMERSAVYRRALAPVTTFVGVVGLMAAAGGWMLNINSEKTFAIYWMAICLVVIGGAFFLVRKQALKNAEPFWSPPTRRVAQAMTPALSVGLASGVFFVCRRSGENPGPSVGLLIISWTLLYGLALHAAGFFMPRGIRVFGWGLLVAGVLVLGLSLENMLPLSTPGYAHAMMGILFGASHLAYGVYLYFTEHRKNEA